MSERLLTVRDRTPLGYRFGKIWHPSWYQDGRKAHGYFEGWYFKCVSRSGRAMAFIPGVALGERPHAFVQAILSGGDTGYWEYPVEDFRFATDRFHIEVGDSSFSSSGMSVDLDGESGRIRGEVTFDDWIPWPVAPLSPGIMGWYRFVPFMETYHGVLGLDHGLDGSLEVDGETVDLTGGRGYVEKDWGRSFPSAWVWAQSNHFEEPGISVTVSVARIPWLRGSFVGYIVGLLHDGRLHTFTTYDGATLSGFDLTDDGAILHLARDADGLSITLEGARPGSLRSPLLGDMSGEALETLEGVALVEMRHGGRTVFAGAGTPAGIELMDPRGELAAGLRSS